MTYLLDTNVLSEPRKPRPNPNVIAWFQSVPAYELHTSVLVLGEIRRGVERLRPQSASHAVGYETMLTAIEDDYADRIVAVDAATAHLWGRLTALRRFPVIDCLLAATALVRGWTLVTRNRRDIEATGVRLLNPFESG